MINIHPIGPEHPIEGYENAATHAVMLWVMNRRQAYLDFVQALVGHVGEIDRQFFDDSERARIFILELADEIKDIVEVALDKINFTGPSMSTAWLDMGYDNLAASLLQAGLERVNWSVVAQELIIAHLETRSTDHA